MKLLIAIVIVLLISALAFSSCKVTEKTIPGVYESSGLLKFRLILNENKTFELETIYPGKPNDRSIDTINNQATGIWQLEEKRLKLMQAKASLIDDSITRFTNISCFNFWDKYGAPISIRYILIPSSKLKPHFGNSLYFFSQDFKPTDTIAFYFDGYPPFHFPGSIPSTIGNNIHKITMRQPDWDDSSVIHLIARKNRQIVSAKAFDTVLDVQPIRFHRNNLASGDNK